MRESAYSNVRELFIGEREIITSYLNKSDNNQNLCKKMRRTGYNTLKNQTDQEAYDALDGHIEDVEEAKFIDCKTEEKPPYKTLCLVFFLFFVGMVSY